MPGTDSGRVAQAALMIALAALAAGSATAQRVPACGPMALPVLRLEDPPPQYRAFCDREPGACDLTGPERIDWTPELHALLGRLNLQVNSEIAFRPETGVSEDTDRWEYPVDCTGDCEDFALEKRRRLVRAGLPSGALTMATAFHEVQFFPHAVLLVETTRGTWALDNLHDAVMCWDALAYRFTRRERADGLWLRFALR